MTAKAGRDLNIKQAFWNGLDRAMNKIQLLSARVKYCDMVSRAQHFPKRRYIFDRQRVDRGAVVVRCDLDQTKFWVERIFGYELRVDPNKWGRFEALAEQSKLRGVGNSRCRHSARFRRRFTEDKQIQVTANRAILRWVA